MKSGMYQIPDSTLLYLGRYEYDAIVGLNLRELREEESGSYFIFSSSISSVKIQWRYTYLVYPWRRLSDRRKFPLAQQVLLFSIKIGTTTLMVVTLENFNIVNLKSSLTSKKMSKTSKWTIIAGKIKHNDFQFFNSK